MCGIAGILHVEGSGRVREETLRAMADSIRHRGPDGYGVWLSEDGRVGLAHRRLAIVDLSDAARQPMTNVDQTVWITYNGEVYNFLELRAELETKGYRFRSRSDTEVLLNMYQEMGDEMVGQLDGDFGFGLWDHRRRRLLLARDRIGVKPVYYTEVNGIFVFASEIKALLQHPAVRRELDEESLYHYLTYLVVPPPETLLKDVKKLPAGSMLTLDLGRSHAGPRISRFWEPLPGRIQPDRKDPDEQFEALFRRAVKKRLMGDVPVGTLFSGGVDSLLNTACFQDLITPERVRTFHVAMQGARHDQDELEWSRRLARKLGTEHHEVTISESDLLTTAEALAGQQDEPLSDPVAIPLFFVTRLARQSGTTVLHAGEGADEIFCGYDSYRQVLRRNARLWEPLKRLPSLVSWLGFLVARGAKSSRGQKIADALRRCSLGQELFMSGAIAYYENEKAQILAPDFRRRYETLDSFDVVSPLYRRIEERCPEASLLEKITFIELQLRLPELLLMRVDKMAMANGVEVRVPFLDRDLVDFALSVDLGFKLRDGVSKEPVKRFASHFLGREDVYRPKVGFGVPIQDWFNLELGSHLRGLIRDDRAFAQAYFNIEVLLRRLSRGPRSVNEAFQLWVIYNLLNWRRSLLCSSPAF